MRLRAAVLTTLTALAIGASVIPASAAGPTISDLAKQVGNDQVLSVCNSADDDSLMGLNCTPVPVTVVSGVPADAYIEGNAVLAACQKEEQSGLINLGAACTPLITQ